MQHKDYFFKEITEIIPHEHMAVQDKHKVIVQESLCEGGDGPEVTEREGNWCKYSFIHGLD